MFTLEESIKLRSCSSDNTILFAIVVDVVNGEKLDMCDTAARATRFAAAVMRENLMLKTAPPAQMAGTSNRCPARPATGEQTKARAWFRSANEKLFREREVLSAQSTDFVLRSKKTNSLVNAAAGAGTFGLQTMAGCHNDCLSGARTPATPEMMFPVASASVFKHGQSVELSADEIVEASFLRWFLAVLLSTLLTAIFSLTLRRPVKDAFAAVMAGAFNFAAAAGSRSTCFLAAVQRSKLGALPAVGLDLERPMAGDAGSGMMVFGHDGIPPLRLRAA